MFNIKIIFLECILFTLISCSQKPLIRNFNSTLWIADRNACQGNRKTLMEQVLSSKQDLLGQPEDRITATLGKPDRFELYERNQKFYVYYLDPGPLCSAKEDNPNMLVIRFSAVGLSDEIFTQRGFSTH